MKLAKKYGVKMGFGTDAAAQMVDTILMEFEARSEFFTPVEMLKQATSINAELLAAGKGELARRSIGGILKKTDDEHYDYPANMRNYIVGLMQRFELCYELPDKRILFPDLLGVNEPPAIHLTVDIMQPEDLARFLQDLEEVVHEIRAGRLDTEGMLSYGGVGAEESAPKWLLSAVEIMESKSSNNQENNHG